MSTASRVVTVSVIAVVGLALVWTGAGGWGDRASAQAPCDGPGQPPCRTEEQKAEECASSAFNYTVAGRYLLRKGGKRTKTVKVGFAFINPDPGSTFFSCEPYGRQTIEFWHLLEKRKRRLARNSPTFLINADTDTDGNPRVEFYERRIPTTRRYTCEKGRGKRNWGVVVRVNWIPVKGPVRARTRQWWLRGITGKVDELGYFDEPKGHEPRLC